MPNPNQPNTYRIRRLIGHIEIKTQKKSTQEKTNQAHRLENIKEHYKGNKRQQLALILRTINKVLIWPQHIQRVLPIILSILYGILHLFLSLLVLTHLYLEFPNLGLTQNSTKNCTIYNTLRNRDNATYNILQTHNPLFQNLDIIF